MARIGELPGNGNGLPGILPTRDNADAARKGVVSSFSRVLAQALDKLPSAPTAQRPMAPVEQRNSGANALPGHQPSAGIGLNERALALRAYRHQLLASNIANADTPHYKAVDINVEEALRAGHTPSTVPLLYRTPAQPSLDGNTVEMDDERAKFAENTLMYHFTLDRVSGHYKKMMEMFMNLR